MSTLITFLPISYPVLASPFCIALSTWVPPDIRILSSLTSLCGAQHNRVFAEAAGWLYTLVVICFVSERSILGSLGMNVCSLSDLRCVTSNLCTEDSCLVLWIHSSFKVILKKKKEFINLKAWSEILSSTAVKFSVKVSALKAYFILQIPLLYQWWCLQQSSFLIMIFLRF